MTDTPASTPKVDPLKPPAKAAAAGVASATPVPTSPPASVPKPDPAKVEAILLSELSALKERTEGALARLEAIVETFGGMNLLSRLSALEHALASFAGPTISQDAHDGLGLFMNWWKDFEGHFARAVAAAKTRPSA